MSKFYQPHDRDIHQDAFKEDASFWTRPLPSPQQEAEELQLESNPLLQQYSEVIEQCASGSLCPSKLKSLLRDTELSRSNLSFLKQQELDYDRISASCSHYENLLTQLLYFIQQDQMKEQLSLRLQHKAKLDYTEANLHYAHHALNTVNMIKTALQYSFFDSEPAFVSELRDSILSQEKCCLDTIDYLQNQEAIQESLIEQLLESEEEREEPSTVTSTLELHPFQNDVDDSEHQLHHSETQEHEHQQPHGNPDTDNEITHSFPPLLSSNINLNNNLSSSDDHNDSSLSEEDSSISEEDSSLSDLMAEHAASQEERDKNKEEERIYEEALKSLFGETSEETSEDDFNPEPEPELEPIPQLPSSEALEIYQQEQESEEESKEELEEEDMSNKYPITLGPEDYVEINPEEIRKKGLPNPILEILYLTKEDFDGGDVIYLKDSTISKEEVEKEVNLTQAPIEDNDSDNVDDEDDEETKTPSSFAVFNCNRPESVSEFRQLIITNTSVYNFFKDLPEEDLIKFVYRNMDIVDRAFLLEVLIPLSAADYTPPQKS